METRFCSRVSQSLRYSLLRRQAPHQTNNALVRWHALILRTSVRCNSTQARTLGGFYESLLENPLPSPPASDPAASKLQSEPPSFSGESSEAQKEEIVDKARVIFGSRLAGPAERRQVKERGSEKIAGVKVPPKPVEPDNCCMSGCVNCVWEVYRDDMEEWATMRKKADRALALAAKRWKVGAGKSGEERQEHTLVSMDDDGGGSESNWISESDIEGTDTNDELFNEIPVGFREFMMQEKRLKEKHLREGTNGG